MAAWMRDRNAWTMITDPRLVVCAVDGSKADATAVEVAAQLAVLADARLALIAVVPLPADGPREPHLQGWTLEEALTALELTARTLDSRVGVDCYVDAGNPIRKLVEFAAQRQALLLVVGTNVSGTGRPPSIVAGGLARAAPCPVVVVPETVPAPILCCRDAT